MKVTIKRTTELFQWKAIICIMTGAIAEVVTQFPSEETDFSPIARIFKRFSLEKLILEVIPILTILCRGRNLSRDLSFSCNFDVSAYGKLWRYISGAVLESWSTLFHFVPEPSKKHQNVVIPWESSHLSFDALTSNFIAYLGHICPLCPYLIPEIQMLPPMASRNIEDRSAHFLKFLKNKIF